MKRLLLGLALFFPFFAQAALPVGEVFKPVTLSGEEGGLVKGGAWDPSSHAGKVVVLFYVDPDEKDLNEDAVEALSALPKGPIVISVAVINLAATWLPNAVIASKLKDSQKEHPLTTYVKDLDKKLVKVWGLGDDTNSLSVIGADSKVVYSYDGKLDAGEIDQMISVLKKAVGEALAKDQSSTDLDTSVPASGYPQH